MYFNLKKKKKAKNLKFKIYDLIVPHIVKLLVEKGKAKRAGRAERAKINLLWT